MSTGYHTLQPTTGGSSSDVSGESFRPSPRTQSSYPKRRPALEFNGRLASYTVPHSFNEFAYRLKVNFNHFRVNYTSIILSILYFGIYFDYKTVSTIVFMMTFILWFPLYFCRDEPIAVFGRTVDDRVVSFALGILTIACLVFTGVWLNVLVSSLIAATLVALHTGFRIPEDLYLDEGEGAEGGLNSVVGSSYGGV